MIYSINGWFLTDDGCYQYMRVDDDVYSMIQIIWLDVTDKDRENGAHEYIVLKDSMLYADIAEDEDAVCSYGYKVISHDPLTVDVGDYKCINNDAKQIIAECVLEDNIINDWNIVFESNLESECQKFIENYISKH